MKIFYYCIIAGVLALATSCNTGESQKSGTKADQPKMIKKTRADGSLQSVSQVDEENFAHGIKVNYYEDGKTIHSKITFEHGLKHGTAIHYYKNGQIFEHTSFSEGKKHGLTKKYYKSGRLAAEFKYDNGAALPGLKEYSEDGKLIEDYPEVHFKKIDKLAFENKLELIISCTRKSDRVKYYELNELDNGKTFKAFKESDKGKAVLTYHLYPGKVLMKKIELYAEIPTDLGNTLVKKFTYQLAAKNVR